MNNTPGSGKGLFLRVIQVGGGVFLVVFVCVSNWGPALRGELDSRTVQIGILGLAVGFFHIVAGLWGRSRPAYELEEYNGQAEGPLVGAEGDLVYRSPVSVFRRKPISVIINRKKGMIHFVNCFTVREFLAHPREQWSCRLHEIKALFRLADKTSETLIISTANGKAKVPDGGPGYGELVTLLQEEVPSNSHEFWFDDPRFITIYCIAAVVGAGVCVWLVPLQAGTASLVGAIAQGGLLGAAGSFGLVWLVFRISRMSGVQEFVVLGWLILVIPSTSWLIAIRRFDALVVLLGSVAAWRWFRRGR